MEKIVNGLVLSPEQKAAFLAAAPGVEQIFLRDGEITAADLSGATVLLGNPSPAVVQQGGHALRWMHTRSAGADPYMPEGILPQAPYSPHRWGPTAFRFRSTCSPCCSP